MNKTEQLERITKINKEIESLIDRIDNYDMYFMWGVIIATVSHSLSDDPLFEMILLISMGVSIFVVLRYMQYHYKINKLFKSKEKIYDNMRNWN